MHVTHDTRGGLTGKRYRTGMRGLGDYGSDYGTVTLPDEFTPPTAAQNQAAANTAADNALASATAEADYNVTSNTGVLASQDIPTNAQMSQQTNASASGLLTSATAPSNVSATAIPTNALTTLLNTLTGKTAGATVSASSSLTSLVMPIGLCLVALLLLRKK
jgi:hypothetical protein